MNLRPSIWCSCSSLGSVRANGYSDIHRNRDRGGSWWYCGHNRISAYTSFAGIYNATSLQDVVPIGEFNVVRQRAERDEMERIRRIHPTDHLGREGSVHA